MSSAEGVVAVRRYITMIHHGDDMNSSHASPEIFVPACTACPRGVVFNRYSAFFGTAPRGPLVDGTQIEDATIPAWLAADVYELAGTAERYQAWQADHVARLRMRGDAAGFDATMRAHMLRTRPAGAPTMDCMRRVPRAIAGVTRQLGDDHYMPVANLYALGTTGCALVTLADGSERETTTVDEVEEAMSACFIKLCVQHGIAPEELDDMYDAETELIEERRATAAAATQ
jgi:hypothetical protein